MNNEQLLFNASLTYTHGNYSFTTTAQSQIIYRSSTVNPVCRDHRSYMTGQTKAVGHEAVSTPTNHKKRWENQPIETLLILY